MRKRITVLLATTAIVAALITGSATTADAGLLDDKEDVGTVFGAIIGGLAGSQFGKGSGQLWATGAGVFLGAIVGRGVGQSLDRTDEMHARRTYNHTLETLPSGYTGGWTNPDNGHSGTYTPTHTYRQPSGQYCREFQQTVTIGGRTQQAYGTACRQPDGSWKIGQDTSAGFEYNRPRNSNGPRRYHFNHHERNNNHHSYYNRRHNHSSHRCLDGDNVCYRNHGIIR